MIYNRIILLFILIFISQKLQSQKMVEYISSNFSIHYLESWEYIENPSTTFIFRRPIEFTGELFLENINLIIIDNDFGFNLSEFSKASESQLHLLKGYSKVSYEITEIEDKTYCKIVYNHEVNDIDLQTAYYILFQNNKFYNFACSSTKNNFSNYISIFEKMITSFKVLD